MTVPPTVESLVAIDVPVPSSAFLSSSETAIFTLPDEWVTAQDSATDQRMATLRELRGDPDRLLVTILVGNTIDSVAIPSITTVLFSEFLPTGSAVAVSTILASVLAHVFGKIVPKSYGLGHATRWALVVARPLTVVDGCSTRSWFSSTSSRAACMRASVEKSE